MSNYLSSEYRITNPVSSVDLQVVDNTLSTLQGKYDTNSALIEQTLAYYNENLKGLRDSDNQYIAEKLKQVKSTIDEYKKKNVNLAYNYNRDSIMSAVKSTLDDTIVQDAIVSRQNYMQYNSQVEKLKEKNPEMLNDVNYKFGLWEGGYYDYMQGKTKKLGTMQYTPYTDLTEEHLDKLKKIKDVKGKRFIEWTDGEGKKITREIDGLDEQEIKNYFGNTISSKELKQLQINGWAKYAQNEQEAKTIFNNYVSKQVEQYNQKIDLEEKRSKVLIGKEKEESLSKIEELKTERDNTKNLVSSDKTNILQIATYLEKEQYLTNFAKMAGATWNQKESIDDVYFAKEKLKIDQEELALKKLKESREQLEFGFKMAKKYGVDANGNPITSGQTSTATTDFKLGEEESQIKSLYDRSAEEFNIITSTAKELISKLPENEKNLFIAELKKRGVDSNLNKIGNGRVVIGDAIEEAFEASKLNKYTDYAIKINRAVENKNSIANDIIKIERDSYREVFSKNPDKYIQDLKGVIEVGGAKAYVDSFNRINNDEAYKKLEGLYKKYTNKDLKILSVTSLGGIRKNNFDKVLDELKNIAVNNPNVLRDIVKLNNDIRSNFALGLKGSNMLEEDTKKKVEATLKDRALKGGLNTMTSYNVVNLLNENTRKDIIQMIPQNLLENSGFLFNEKQPISVRKVEGGKVQLLQYQGSEVVDKKTGKSRPKYATVNIDKTEVDLYNKLNNYIDLEEQSKRKSSAASFVDTKPLKPNLSLTNDESLAIVEKSITYNPNIKNVFVTVGGDPRYYATTNSIEKTLPVILNKVLPEESSSKFTDKYVDNLSKFRLQITTKPNLRSSNPGDLTFALNVINPNGKTIIENKSLNTDELDDTAKYLMKTKPQLFITELITQEILENNKFVNTVFK